MPIDPKKLEEWKRLAEAATPGPWRTGRKVFRTCYGQVNGTESLIGLLDRSEDAAFAAAAREAVPVLLAEAETKATLETWMREAEGALDRSRKRQLEVGRLRELLREVEWSGEFVPTTCGALRTCPKCRNTTDAGHAEGCALAAALK
jgi:hypothetical protein